MARDTSSLGEIMADVLGLEPGQWDRSVQMRVSNILQRVGWERYREPRGDRSWRYRLKARETIEEGPSVPTCPNPL